MKKIYISLLAIGLLTAQTVDWTQIRPAGRLGAGLMGQSTGIGLSTNLPSICIVGQQFFATDVAPGTNLFFCTSVNVWTQQSVNVPITSGYVTVQINGSPFTARTRLNFLSGSGTTVSCIDNAGNASTDCTISDNFAVALSIAAAQSGVIQYCTSANSSATALTCSLANSGGTALVNYTTGMVIALMSTTTTSGTPTLQIDNVGSPVALKQKDCSTTSGSDFTSNQMKLIWYNGTYFCEI